MRSCIPQKQPPARTARSSPLSTPPSVEERSHPAEAVIYGLLIHWRLLDGVSEDERREILQAARRRTLYPRGHARATAAGRAGGALRRRRFARDRADPITLSPVTATGIPT